MGTYRVFFDQSLSFQDPIDGPIRGQVMTGFAQLPFDGRNACLSKSFVFKPLADFDDAMFFNLRNPFRAATWRLGLIFVPILLA